MASVEMPGSYSSMSSTGFRELAGYIFGVNDEQKKISMTALVHVTTTDSISTMSFVMKTAWPLIFRVFLQGAILRSALAQ